MANPPITSENEDLFDFDNDRHAAATPSAASAPKPAPVKEPAIVAATQLPPVQGAVEHVPETRAPVPVTLVASTPATPAALKSAPPPMERKGSLPTRALLAVAILVNVALVGVVWNSMSG